MKTPIARSLVLAALALPSLTCGQPAEPDPNGVLLKPIPDKLIVLTFDDGCASGYTVAAPILKSLGFGGSFYVCDFDSFKTRKDWYLTFRQMQAMAADGLEIGNHTVGHWGGLDSFLAMEDQMLANHVPKPTTVCWPLYQADPASFPDLAKHGYTFGRGGHDRPYRPTVDNPFDVPSFTLRDGVPIETFIKQAQQARQGRVVVFTLHGVPDLEHGAVGLEPATFKVMMQYLKDNHYQVIAMRDLAKFIDPAKAAKLPPTAKNVNVPELLVKDDKPYVGAANEIRTFGFPDQPLGSITGTSISVTVPYAADLTALAPNITLSADATISPASGTARDFTKPQTYTVTGKDGSKQAYTVTVTKAPVSQGKEMLTFTLPGPIPGIISGNRITVYAPPSADVKALAPTLTLSPFATWATTVPPSGTAQDFTKPQTYTVTAQDGSSQVYTVTVIKTNQPNAFTWSKAEPGTWSDGSKWSNNLSNGNAPLAAGQPDYILNFNLDGNHAVTNDLQDGFQLNQLNLGEKFGLNLAGKRVALVTNSATGSLPKIHVNTSSEGNPIAIPIELAADTTVNVRLGGRVFIKSLISGKGSLTLECPGSTNNYQNWGILRIENKLNTYSGGTIINGGQLFLLYAERGLGTGPVTLNDGADIRLECNGMTNPLIINGGTIEGGTWNAPITLNGNARFAGTMNLNEAGGGMSGPGGFTQIGPIGPFSRVNAGELSLWGTNTYAGPTTVQMGTLIIRRAVALYNAEPANWTPAKITVHPAATLYIPTGGPGEFTGAQVGTLLTKLTTAVNHNGLMAGAIFCVDTAKAAATVTVASNITDGKGPGGGAFVLKKCQAGTLQITGANTYTGQTVLEGGTLSVDSLNSVVKGKPGSSLGVPTNVEAGEIVIGKDQADGECALVYTGKGETSDRVMNLAGKNSTVTFAQSGSGLLKLTSALLISGYGANKTIVLTGDTAGTGEFAGTITNPHDRAGKATTSVTKSGTGTWTLSGTNTYTGPTTVTQGTLSLTTARGLGPDSEVSVAAGATLDLNFKGPMKIRRLSIDGKPQPAGIYNAAGFPKALKGTGLLMVVP
ncbi:MAG: autotransporter-associated beta strand repeat-containing protein [Verrucomicrobia bacterium]|nr:autotransporter-associated beta strand repeat-containing protein [Verrucomicrobiota bacterium]